MTDIKELPELLRVFKLNHPIVRGRKVEFVSIGFGSDGAGSIEMWLSLPKTTKPKDQEQFVSLIMKGMPHRAECQFKSMEDLESILQGKFDPVFKFDDELIVGNNQ